MKRPAVKRREHYPVKKKAVKKRAFRTAAEFRTQEPAEVPAPPPPVEASQTPPADSGTPESPPAPPREPFDYPATWSRGQLLNTRAQADAVYITPLGEEYDRRYPEKGLRIEHREDAQNFISWWYARESGNPLAR